MTAATALSSVAQSAGAGAAAAASSALPAASAVPQIMAANAAGTAQLAQNLAFVEKPVSAAAQGAQRLPMLTRVAGFLSKALPIATIAASTMSGAQIVQRDGVDALWQTKQGRGAALGAIGGALLLIPFPPAKLAAAGVLGLSAANHFGGLERLDRPQGPPTPQSAPPPGPPREPSQRPSQRAGAS